MIALDTLRARIAERVDARDTHAIRRELLDWAMDGAEYEASTAADALTNIMRRLETTDCAACAAPGGLIYNTDLAKRACDWWQEIDEALDDYHEATGEWFTVKSVGGLVWFAVEWNASEIVSIIDSTREDILEGLDEDA